MTTFKLSTGRPAPFLRSGPPARPVEETPDTHPGRFIPANEPDTPLACGCKIPWPVIQGFGNHVHGKVLCSEHGYQPKITKQQIEDARREARCHSTRSLSTLDLPPF